MTTGRARDYGSAMRLRLLLTATALVFAAGCGSDAPAADAGSSRSDADHADTGPEAPDAGPVADAASAIDAGLPTDAGLAADSGPATAPDAGPAHDAGPPSDAGPPPPVVGDLWRRTAERGQLADFVLQDAQHAADGAIEMIAGRGTTARDPFGAGNYQGGTYYNGGSYRYAVASSPDVEWAHGVDQIVPSFEVDTPPGTWVNVKVSARVGGRWTREYVLGIWAFDEGTVRRHSVDDQDDADARVLTDTLVLTQRADALRMVVVLFSERVDATPRLRALSLSAIDATRAATPDQPDRAVWGTVLPVPMRSQMIYPDGGEVWCSPTSLTMLLAYWADTLADPRLSQRVPSTAQQTYDWIYDGNGNWPFNTAHAAAVGGGVLHGFVTRLRTFAQVERLVAAGIPVAISVSYGRGELRGSPIGSTAGHLIVVRGIAANGDVVANDPAFPTDAQVQVTYDRAQLDRAWSHSGRTTYVVHPRGQALPTDPLGGW